MSEVRTEILLDRSEQKIIVASWQDVEAFLDENKRLQNEPQKRGDFFLYARVPYGKILEWLNKEWAKGNPVRFLGDKEFDALLERNLNDPDNKYLRVDGPKKLIGWGD